MAFDKTDDLISVIVPVYNVEPWLTKCLDSLVKQTWTNMEILLIDDGSTDNGGLICDDFASRDRRFKVFHTPNMGVSDARNLGLDKATGNYLGFIDPDDYVLPGFYSALMSAMKAHDADIVLCGFMRIGRNGKKLVPEKSITVQELEVWENDKILQALYQSNQMILSVVWNKLYKKELFKGLRFPSGKYMQDNYVSFRFLLKSDKVVLLTDRLYFYNQRAGNITSHGLCMDRMVLYDSLKEQLQYFDDKGDTFMAQLVLLHIEQRIRHMLVNYHRREQQDIEILHFLVNLYRDYYKKLLKFRGLPLKRKLKFLLTGTFPVPLIRMVYKSKSLWPVLAR
jgi:glycosyltransferase involved in cell wall biosynthesis